MYFLQKDTDHAVVVAVAAHAVFEPGLEDVGDVYRVGVASTLLKVKLCVLFFVCRKKKMIGNVSCSSRLHLLPGF